MREEGQSIYKDGETLCDLLDECELMMTKVNRRIYLTRARELAEDILTDFTIAYESKQDRYHYFVELYRTYCAVLTRVRRIINKGRLTSPSPNNGKRVATMEKELAECLDRIRTGLRKWRATIVINDDGHDPGRLRPGQENKPKGASLSCRA